jgi:hypothetical protein
MRTVIMPGLLLLTVTVFAAAQDEDREPPRYGVKRHAELYPQDSPKKTLNSMARAFEKDRFDYLVAQLIDPAFVDEQLRISYPDYEKAGREQVTREDLERKGFDKGYVRQRVKELASDANFQNLVRRVRVKLEDDPVSLQELKRMVREGEVQEAAETAVVRLKDVKDRALYLRKVGDRWYVENRMLEDKPAE